MITTNPLDLTVHVDPISFTAELETLAGNTVQTFNADITEYEPDRTLVPLILMPRVVVADPEGMMNGNRPVTGAEWYEGAPRADKSNLVTSGTDYELGDGTVEGFPQWALKVKKNVPPATPLELTAVFAFTDTRRGREVTVERSAQLYTALFDSRLYSLRLDQPRAWTLDPLQVVPDADGAWPVDIAAQLLSGSEAVDDAHAAYWWQLDDGTGWRDFTEEDIDLLLLSGRTDDGQWTRAIRVDARMFSRMSFRCRAAWFDTERPSAPADNTLQAATSVKVELPPSLTAAIIQTKGVRVNARMTTPVAFRCLVAYNKGELTDTQYAAFTAIAWQALSSKPGSRAVSLGTGRTVEFAPSAYGFDINYPVNVTAQVKLYVCHAAITDDDGNYLTDDDGALLIDPVME